MMLKRYCVCKLRKQGHCFGLRVINVAKVFPIQSLTLTAFSLGPIDTEWLLIPQVVSNMSYIFNQSIN